MCEVNAVPGSTLKTWGEMSLAPLLLFQNRIIFGRLIRVNVGEAEKKTFIDLLK